MMSNAERRYADSKGNHDRGVTVALTYQDGEGAALPEAWWWVNELLQGKVHIFYNDGSHNY